MKTTKKKSQPNESNMQMSETGGVPLKVGTGFVLVVDIGALRAGEKAVGYVTNATSPTNKGSLVIPIPENVLVRDLKYVLQKEMQKVVCNLSALTAENTNIRCTFRPTKTAHTESALGVKSATTRATKNGKQNK